MSSKAVPMRTLVILGIASLLFLAGSGGGTASVLGNQPPPPAGLAVSPASATVQTGGEQQFIATVSPVGANQAVTWGVSGSRCTGTSRLQDAIDANQRRIGPIRSDEFSVPRVGPLLGRRSFQQGVCVSGRNGEIRAPKAL